MRNPKYRFQK
ncbi:hypothetical protein D031_1589A, partial [Vibrio parahaemolyticus VP-48]